MKMKSRSLSVCRRCSWEKLSLPRSVYKVVVLGAGGVGKTSLIQRYVMDDFPIYYQPTVDESYEKSVSFSKDFSAFFEIRDTAGAYQFPAMKRLTIEHGDAFILVYSLTDENSIKEMLQLRQDIIDIKGTADVPMVIVGNKADLVSKETRDTIRQRLVYLLEGQNLIRSETSAKFSINVSGVFRALLGQIAVVNSLQVQHMSAGHPRKVSKGSFR